MVQRISLDEAEERLHNNHGNNIKMYNYYSINSTASFECCICGNKWDTIASSVLNIGTGCDRCADIRNGKKIITPIEDVSEEIESFGCELLSEQYNGKRNPILVLFSCGHSEETTLVLLREMKNKSWRSCRNRNRFYGRKKRFSICFI
jgi:hypothetical protein